MSELDLEALLSDIPNPRDQHYMFAHVALPRLILALSPSKIELADKADDVSYFRGIWADLAEFNEGEPLSDAGMAVDYRQAGELEALIVTLPKAEIPSEAIMVAIVRFPVRRLLLLRGKKLRYFTLELGLSFTDDMQLAGHRTVLCEWNEDGHLNYGDGPPANVDAFAAAVFGKCTPS